MERHTKIRKWIIYSGAFFLALSTVITIVSSSSRFNAQVAIEPCLAIADVNGDGLVNESDCTGGGGGGTGGGVEPCLDEAEAIVQDSTIASIPVEPKCTCYSDPPFDAAHESHTTASFGSGGTAMLLDQNVNSESSKILGVGTAFAQSGGQLGESEKVSQLFKKVVGDLWSQGDFYMTRTKVILTKPASYFRDPANAQRFADTFISETIEILNDPSKPFYAQIKDIEKRAPEIGLAAMASFAYGKKADHSKSHASDRNDRRGWEFSAKPNFKDWTRLQFGIASVEAEVTNYFRGNQAFYVKAKCDPEDAKGSLTAGYRYDGRKGKVDLGVQFGGSRTTGYGFQRAYVNYRLFSF